MRWSELCRRGSSRKHARPGPPPARVAAHHSVHSPPPPLTPPPGTDRAAAVLERLRAAGQPLEDLTEASRRLLGLHYLPEQPAARL